MRPTVQPLVSEVKEVNMDTDDLTPMAYEIIIKANGILDVLKTEIGASCETYDSEDSFLKGTLVSIDRKIAGPESYLEYWNYIDAVEISWFVEKLQMLKEKVKDTIATPDTERGKPPFR